MAEHNHRRSRFAVSQHRSTHPGRLTLDQFDDLAKYRDLRIRGWVDLAELAGVATQWKPAHDDPIWLPVFQTPTGVTANKPPKTPPVAPNPTAVNAQPANRRRVWERVVAAAVIALLYVGVVFSFAIGSQW